MISAFSWLTASDFKSTIDMYQINIDTEPTAHLAGDCMFPLVDQVPKVTFRVSASQEFAFAQHYMRTIPFMNGLLHSRILRPETLEGMEKIHGSCRRVE